VTDTNKLVDAAIHNGLIDLLKALRTAYPTCPSAEIGDRVALTALIQAGVKVKAAGELLTAAPRRKVW
jgi:hypothetical protein